jgi:DNA-binding MarR family transcriptional regulator
VASLAALAALGYVYESVASSELTQKDLDFFRKHNIGQHLMEVARDYQKRALVAFADAGHGLLQPSHQAVLTHLRLSGTRLTDLADRASMTKQAMGQLVDEVERLGYVERVPDPSDGRAKIVRFTVAGLELVKVGTEIGFGIHEEYAALVGKKKMKLLHDILEDLHASTRPDGDAPTVRPRPRRATTRRRHHS